MKKFLVWILLLLLLLMFYLWQKEPAPLQPDTPAPQPAALSIKKQPKAKKKVSAQGSAGTIHFSITKHSNMLLLSGTFTDRKQSKLFARNLRPTYSTAHLKENPALKDKGGMALAAKILPLFKKSYHQGKIQYSHGMLTVEGTVPSQKILDQVNTLLQNAEIPLKNLTTVAAVAPNSIPRPSKPKVPKPKQKRVQQSAEFPPQIAKTNRTLSDQKILTPQIKTVSKKVPQKEKKLGKVVTKSVKSMPAIQQKPSVKARIKTLLRTQHIEFLPAKGALTPEGEQTVDRLAKILSIYPRIHIEIAGHTDSDGSESFNQKLSQKRVDAVKKRLVSKGISPKRLRAKGYGESQPLVPNTSDENKQKNRRVEITVLKQLKL